MESGKINRIDINGMTKNTSYYKQKLQVITSDFIS